MRGWRGVLAARIQVLPPASLVLTLAECTTSPRGRYEIAGDGLEGKMLAENELNGVGDGFRTRDFRIHNPALYP